MARTSIQKDTVKDVNYLNKDFNDFKNNLIELTNPDQFDEESINTSN